VGPGGTPTHRNGYRYYCGKAGYFPRRDTTHFAETNLGYHALKAGSRDATHR
jgi:hypothetical protein